MSGKVKVSKEEFAAVLLKWFTMHCGREGIQQAAKQLDLRSEKPCWEAREAKELFGLKLSNTEEFAVLAEELMKLNLWIIVTVCKTVINDVEKRDECLDILHRRLFDEFFAEAGYEFQQWLSALKVRYDEYREAMRTGSPEKGTGLMVLGEAIYRNLHGDDLPGALRVFEIVVYVGENIKALEGLVKEYEIE